MPPLSVRLFGKLRASAGDTPVTSPMSERDQALFAYLLLNPDESHSRSRSAHRFWPGSVLPVATALDAAGEIVRTCAAQTRIAGRRGVGTEAKRLAAPPGGMAAKMSMARPALACAA